MSKLLSPLQIKNITLRNRIVMSPMCMYSSENGYADNWHFVHYATRAVGGCGAIIQEATAVSPEGRISYGDLGIWDDKQVSAYQKMTSFIAQHGTVPGIQLAHAGRKASCNLPQNGEGQLKSGPNSWQTVAPSPIPFHESDNAPAELTKEGIEKVVKDFEAAAVRATNAGYKILEIHAAHGYLIHEFLSPLTNKRTDEYGGSFENRVRLLLQIVKAIGKVLQADQSLWVRISATDWVDGGWDIEESVKLSALLKESGVDVMDVSTGGNLPHVRIPVAPGYQVPFAEKVKKQVGITTGAVGLITEARQAEKLLVDNKCDLVILGRVLLRDPYFALNAQKVLGETANAVPAQYRSGF